MTCQCTVATTFPSHGTTVSLLIFHYLASQPYSCFRSYFKNLKFDLNVFDIKQVT